MDTSILTCLSENELYEINDAIAEVVRRMVEEGQDEVELRNDSLKTLWRAWGKINVAVCGTDDTPGRAAWAPVVEQAIRDERQCETRPGGVPQP